MVRDEALARDVVLVDPPVAFARVEDVHRLAGREAPQVGHADLDHEAAARLEVRRDVAEARDLLRLRRQVVDRVEDEVGKAEGALDAGAREVADRDRDLRAARLLAQLRDHRLREVDAMHLHPALSQRKRDPAGADPELERSTVARELGEQVDGRLHDLR